MSREKCTPPVFADTLYLGGVWLSAGSINYLLGYTSEGEPLHNARVRAATGDLPATVYVIRESFDPLTVLVKTWDGLLTSSVLIRMRLSCVLASVLVVRSHSGGYVTAVGIADQVFTTLSSSRSVYDTEINTLSVSCSAFRWTMIILVPTIYRRLS